MQGMRLLPISVDPPRHTMYRTPLNQPLSAKSVAGLETAIRAMMNEGGFTLAITSLPLVWA